MSKVVPKGGYAVMAQTPAVDKYQWFPTPCWSTRALCIWLEKHFGPLKDMTCAEPACGQGHMSRPLAEYFGSVRSSDVYPYGFGEVDDFLLLSRQLPPTDFYITNPPYTLGEQFANRAIDCADVGVALLVRTAFLEGVGRYETLFSKRAPSAILQFTERVPMFKGRVDPKGSTATAYCWIVWNCRGMKPRPGGMPSFAWIPPSRRALERPGDYDAFNIEKGAPAP